jgi:excisionase family DNA binding protein
VREDARMIPQNEQVERLAVNIQHAAQMLDVSPRTIENYLRAKILPARKIGRRTVIPVSALRAFLNRDQTLTQSPKWDAEVRELK